MCGVRVSGFWLNTYFVAKGFDWRLFSSKDKILIQRVNMVKFNSVSNYWTNILRKYCTYLFFGSRCHRASVFDSFPQHSLPNDAKHLGRCSFDKYNFPSFNIDSTTTYTTFQARTSTASWWWWRAVWCWLWWCSTITTGPQRPTSCLCGWVISSPLDQLIALIFH